MKNPHGVKPTRFMKREESHWAFISYPDYGPTFGDNYSDIRLIDRCNEENSCFIDNNGTGSYICHPKFKSSLFVNTAGPYEKNYFTVLDYEVYTHN